MKARLVLATALAAVTFAGAAYSQHAATPHPAMPETKPPPLVFPMSSDNFRKLVNWYVDLAHKNTSRLSDDSRANLDLAILRVRDCTSSVTSDGVVTGREANACLHILQQVTMRPRPH